MPNTGCHTEQIVAAGAMARAAVTVSCPPPPAVLDLGRLAELTALVTENSVWVHWFKEPTL